MTATTHTDNPGFKPDTAARLAQMWGLVDDAGVTAARTNLDNAMHEYARVTTVELDARATERITKDAYDTAAFQAEQDADMHADRYFETEGNKTWLLQRVGEGWTRLRTVTADQRRAWTANLVRQAMADHPAAKAHRTAEDTLAGARRDVAVAAARVSAAKHHLDACVAVLATLTHALPPPR